MAGAAGDSTAQGTCAATNEVCNADGTCAGIYYYHIPIKILQFIININIVELNNLRSFLTLIYFLKSSR